MPLSLRLFKEIHKKLLSGVRGGHATPGEFRRSQNWIGPQGSTLSNATYIPPPPDALMGVLGEWEKFLHDRSHPPLFQIALAHSQFEAIHPFLDGNGRIGRLLITLFLVEREILPAPLLFLSAYFQATRQKYYDRLLGVTEKGQWEEWLLYFLNGVARQSEDALGRARRINDLIARWRHDIAGLSSKVPDRVVDLTAENPFWSINKIAERLDVAFTTAQRAVKKLEERGILVQTSEGERNRIYCAKAVLKILEEPASLKPVE
jgi:Fic family protein